MNCMDCVRISVIRDMYFKLISGHFFAFFNASLHLKCLY